MLPRVGTRYTLRIEFASSVRGRHCIRDALVLSQPLLDLFELDVVVSSVNVEVALTGDVEPSIDVVVAKIARSKHPLRKLGTRRVGHR